MNDPAGNGRQSNEFADRWCNDELQIEMGTEHIQPPQPITGERLENLKAERARRVRLDPLYRAHLESRDIFLTPEEQQEPPAGTALGTP